jgi:hypothetical protein
LFGIDNKLVSRWGETIGVGVENAAASRGSED